jgi:hypothetical protein
VETRTSEAVERSEIMYVIREVLNCKPGKVRQMIEKFRSISAVLKEMGGNDRVFNKITARQLLSRRSHAGRRRRACQAGADRPPDRRPRYRTIQDSRGARYRRHRCS